MKKTTLWFLLRSGLTVIAMLALYAVIPVPGHRRSLALTVILAVAGLAGLTYAFLTLAERARRSTDQNAVRLEAVVAVLYAFVVFMSLVYLGLASQEGQFSELNNRVDALYFTMSTIATVGFGDVHATGEVSRAVVTVQIALDLVFVALVARIILPSVVSRRAKARDSEAGEPSAETRDGDHPDVPTTS
jgi:voltage-gated potassium channel